MKEKVFVESVVKFGLGDEGKFEKKEEFVRQKIVKYDVINTVDVSIMYRFEFEVGWKYADVDGIIVYILEDDENMAYIMSSEEFDEEMKKYGIEVLKKEIEFGEVPKIIVMMRVRKRISLVEESMNDLVEYYVNLLLYEDWRHEDLEGGEE